MCLRAEKKKQDHERKRGMELEIFKGITHSYDTQEMFAMKSSLKNLNCGFSNHETRNFQGDYPFV